MKRHLHQIDFFMKKLFNLRICDSNYVVNHLNEFNIIWSQFESLEVTFADDIKALIVLCSLHKNWNNIVLTISSASKRTLKFDDAVNIVLNHKLMKKSLGDSSMLSNGEASSNALSPFDNKRWDRGRSRSRRITRERGRSISKGRRILCWIYRKQGHIKRSYPNQEKDGANVANPKEEFDDLCLSQ